MLYKSKSTGKEIEIQAMNDGYLWNLYRKLERELEDTSVIKTQEWYDLWDAVKLEYNNRFTR